MRSRILYLRYSTITPGQQLNELLPISYQLEKCPQQNDSVRVLLLQRIGALYYLTGNYREAVIFTEASIKLLQDKQNTYTDPAFMVRVYDFLRIYYDSLKLTGSKMNAIDSSIHYALMINAVDQDVIYNIWERSAYTLDIGDFQRCINYSSLGETLTNKYVEPENRLVFTMNFFTNRMSALMGINDLGVAEKELHKKINEFTLSGQENQCCSFYHQLSIIARDQGKIEDALKYLEKTFNCNKRNGSMLQCKQTKNNIGFLYLNYINDPQGSLRYLREALNYKTLIDEEFMYDQIESANILDNIAIAFARLNQFDSSFLYFHRAFNVIGENTDENTINSMPMDEFTGKPLLGYVTSLIREKGNAYARRYEVTGNQLYLNESLRIFKIADKVLTKIKTTQAELQSRLAWRRNARILYEQAINTCYSAKRPEEAFYFFERSRAVLLNDQIGLNRGMSTHDNQARSQIEAKLVQLNSRLETIPRDADEYTDVQKNILFLTQQKDRILTHKILNDTASLSLKLFREKYEWNGETILEIFKGDSAVFILSINAGDIHLKKISKETFNTLSSEFIAYISDPVKLNSNYNDFLRVSGQLYHLLSDDMNIEGRLIVSPDGDNFPFEALIVSVKNNEPVYLIEERSVVYTYSAGFLLLDFISQNERATPKILGIAPVHFPAIFNLTSLQGSGESMNRIVSKFASSHSFMESAATRASFLDHFYQYTIVQLYTHGSETGKLNEPVIYFADSALNLSDLIPVDKPTTRLVVLSACETGKGKYYQGEGVFSFNRAFAEAGIPTAMVNLWSVDNQSTYQLTELFYKYLAKGMSFDESLRHAKIEFISTADKERSLPFYWAATVIAGQSSPAHSHSKISWVTISIASLMILALVIAAFRYFNYKGPYT